MLVLGAPDVGEVLAESIGDAYRQGGDAEAWEDQLLAPPPMGRALANSLRHGHRIWYEGKGHGLWFKHWPETLDTLLGDQASRRN